MDDSGNMVRLTRLKGLRSQQSENSDTDSSSHSGHFTHDELKSLRSYKSHSSHRSSIGSNQEHNMLDLLLPRPVFKWKDPTLVPRYCHKIEFCDIDPARLKANTPEILVQNIVQRLKFTDGKIRSINFENLIKVIRGNGLARNSALFQRILSQRGSIPIMFEAVDPTGGVVMDSFVKALEFFEV